MGNKLHIYTASAGSGKTYTIAQEYLRLALSRRGNYRHIQAVTFTNKATEEMKSRILDKLHDIALDRDESLGQYLMDALGITQAELRVRAQSCLRAMLLDYGSFRISTIDSFFQEVLRSFARELNLSGSFRLELENKATIDAATTALFVESYKQGDNELTEWITALSLNQIEQNESYDPRKEIKKLSEQLEKQELRKLQSFPTIGEVRGFRDYLNNYLHTQEEYCKHFAGEIKQLLEPLLSVGCEFNSRGAIGYLKKLYTGNIEVASKSFLEAMEAPEKFFKEASKKKVIKEYDFGVIKEKLQHFRDSVLEGELRHYISAKAILQNIYALGLLSALQSKIREIQRSNNYILLSDAPSFINQILTDDGGVPFLYERIGTRIKHHMIDEFQDTSRIQYDNFLPLLEEALASGDEQYRQDSIIVGDVKQSIYRFRGSDSSQLKALESGESLDLNLELHRLSKNWRSCAEIVQFNNKLYELLPSILRGYYEEWINSVPQVKLLLKTLERELSTFELNYDKAAQTVQKNHPGAVVVHECLYERFGEDEDSETIEEGTEDSNSTHEHTQKLSYQLPEVIKDIYRRGFKPCDIAILVRTKEEASIIANILQNADDKPREGFDFISLEALKPNEAVAVSLLITVLQYLVKPKDKGSREQVLALYREMSGGAELSEERLLSLQHLGQRSLYETIESIIAEFREEISLGEMPYLIKVLDTALSYQQDLSVDINDFLYMWAERSEGFRLSLPADENKIHLMTIHKSKGLDFPIVLLPFPTWGLVESKTNNILWCDNPFLEHTGIEKVPIKASEGLLSSDFAGDYLRDCMLSGLDSLNLLYVATTRAEREMHLWLIDRDSCKQSKNYKLYSHIKVDDTEVMPKGILPILQMVLNEMPEHYIRLGLTSDNFGNLPHKENKLGEKPNDSSTHRLEIKQIASYAIGNRIEELREGLAYFEGGSKRHFGSVMHQILSELGDFSDVKRVQDEVLSRGDLLPEEQTEALRYLDYLLSQPEAQAWFDGSGQVRNEVAILGSKDGVYRPDRIITYPDGSAVVVDYKFGQQRSYYKRQVVRYAQLIKSMGYSPVNAYLWYLSGEELKSSLNNSSFIQHIATL